MVAVECRCWVVAVDTGAFGIWDKVYDNQAQALDEYEFYKSRGQACFMWELTDVVRKPGAQETH